MKINRHILDNGLRLVHSRDESTQMVALNILYNVGARDEHPEHTGFAHLFVEQGRDILFQWQQRVVGIVAPVILHDLAVLFGRFVVLRK